MERHFADERRILVSLHEFSRSFPAYRFLLVLGVPAGQGTNSTQPSVLRMLSIHAQGTIRGLFVILDDIFRSGHHLRRIHPGSFVVDQKTGVPLLSAQGRRDLVPTNDRKQMDSNVRELATIVRSSVLRSTSARVAVQEVEELLQLMERQGRTTWPVIVRHPSLLPLENRLTFQNRLHQELFKVLSRTYPGKCLNVLRRLQFPQDWHSRATNNTILNGMYKGSTYNTMDMSIETQAWEILRFTRNGDQHGPDRAVARGATTAAFRSPDIAVIFAWEFPLLLHSLLLGMFWEGQLGNVSLDSLFCYPPP